jgi:hypothetical protein
MRLEFFSLSKFPDPFLLFRRQRIRANARFLSYLRCALILVAVNLRRHPNIIVNDSYSFFGREREDGFSLLCVTW